MNHDSSPKSRPYLVAASISGGLAVIFGAFGAHGLEARLTNEMLAVYETGVAYHFYHTLAVLAVSLSGGAIWNSRLTTAACLCWLGGIVVFSGSLYLLAMTGMRWMGAITPIGGVAFIAGWALMVMAALKTARAD